MIILSRILWHAWLGLSILFHCIIIYFFLFDIEISFSFYIRSSRRDLPGEESSIQFNIWPSCLNFHPHSCWLSPWRSYQPGSSASSYAHFLFHWFSVLRRKVMVYLPTPDALKPSMFRTLGGSVTFACNVSELRWLKFCKSSFPFCPFVCSRIYP